MINNCPTIPEYTIEQCFETLTLNFNFIASETYIVKFTDNVGNIYKVEVESIGPFLVLQDIPVIDTIYSPLLVEVYFPNECNPLPLMHCGISATQFILNVKQGNGYIMSDPIVPCCPPYEEI